MVGEIRDNETASLAINASLTGHLVLSTLHTNSAAGSLPRLLDMEIEPFLIASTVNCIEAQRLVRRLHDDKEKYNLSKDEIASLGKEININKIVEALRKEKIIGENGQLEDATFFRPKPSVDCPDGYKSRIGIHEVLEISEAIRQLIVKKTNAEEIENQARAEGMLTMLEDGFIKAARGLTSIEEVLRVTKE